MIVLIASNELIILSFTPLYKNHIIYTTDWNQTEDKIIKLSLNHLMKLYLMNIGNQNKRYLKT